MDDIRTSITKLLTEKLLSTERSTSTSNSQAEIVFKINNQALQLWHDSLLEIGNKLFRRAIAVSTLNNMKEIDEKCITIAFETVQLNAIKNIDADKWYDDTDDDW